MSTDFSNVQAKAYTGELFPGALPLPQPLFPPTVISLLIDWTRYGGGSANPIVGISVNLQAGTPRQKLQRIGSVYIDNTSSPVPIYVQFPDTGYTITAAPNTSGWHIAYTNVLNCTIYAKGLSTGIVPMTRVFFTNQIVAPDNNPEVQNAIALWFASPTLARTGLFNTAYGSPGLGDQANLTELIANGVGANALVFSPTQGSPVLTPSKFLLINAMMVNILSGGAAAFDSGVRVDLTESGVSTVLYSWGWNSLAGIKAQFNLPTVSGVNIKLDGSKSYSVRQVTGSNTADRFILNVVFTQSNIG